MEDHLRVRYACITTAGHEAVAKIGKLYRIENELREEHLDDGQFLAERRARVEPEPELENLKNWLSRKALHVVPTSLHWLFTRIPEITDDAEWEELLPQNLDIDQINTAPFAGVRGNRRLRESTPHGTVIRGI